MPEPVEEAVSGLASSVESFKKAEEFVARCRQDLANVIGQARVIDLNSSPAALLKDAAVFDGVLRTACHNLDFALALLKKAEEDLKMASRNLERFKENTKTVSAAGKR